MVVLPRNGARLSIDFINTITLRAGMLRATVLAPGPDSLPAVGLASPYADICWFGSQSSESRNAKPISAAEKVQRCNVCARG
ncbi:hypothetical protein GCM10011400_26180 [Paraburkholderia caffeinilytica]|uniref:Uncharacterized protein n=1 Tax=Paraburkholderia caffeinilytica TaxID=1761016 RepID=A0ABQ1MDE4_9BURK|nr:hypothetical protein GCM10011400_26180 [Paraburkholderia caffeinilytica]